MASLVFLLSFKSVQAAGWKSVEKILGREGTEQGRSFLVSFPRFDLNVVVKGVPLEPEMALTSRFIFSPQEKETLLHRGSVGQAQVRGELVVLDQELSKVLAQLVRQGFAMEALYSPLLNESPQVKTLQIVRQGPRSDLAQGLKALLSVTSTPLEKPMEPTPKVEPRRGTLQGRPEPTSLATVEAKPPPRVSPTPDWGRVEKILGPGVSSGKLSQYVFSRSPTPEGGEETTFILQRDGKQVAATGVFCLAASEVRPVVESLTQNHLTVTGLHQAQLEGNSGFFLLHFWAMGEAEDVAKGLQAALEKTPGMISRLP